MSSGQKKVLSVDLLSARSIGSRDYRNGTDISQNYILAADGRGGSAWVPNIAMATNAFSAVSVGNPVSDVIYAGGLGSGNTLHLDASGYITLTPVPTSNKIIIGVDSSQFVTYETVGSVIDETIDARLGNQLDTLGGTRSYVSTSGLVSTVAGLGLTYMSTASVTSTLNEVLPSTVAGLGQRYVSTQSLTSTVASLTTSIEDVSGYLRTNYPTNQTLTNSVNGLGSVGYVSTFSLASTVAGLGLTYMSTASVTSTLNEVLPSTVAGLGQRYVSSQSLTSTVAGLGLTYMSTASVTSTFNEVLPSTVAGLGQRYISTQSLTSTVAGLGLTYMSTSSVTSTLNEVLPSTVAGLGQRYISTQSLTSTVASLTTSIQDVSGYLRANYPTNQTLTSRVDGLGGTYVSTFSLTSSIVSTTIGLERYTDNKIAALVNGAPATLDTLNEIAIALQNTTVTEVLTDGIVSLRTDLSGEIIRAQNQEVALNTSIQDLSGYLRTNYPTNQTLTSRVDGLGGIGYVSTFSLASTVAGLGLTYMSTPSVTSTLNTVLPSTVAGLGQIYVSTLGLTNTVAGLGLTYMSTPSVTSTLNTVLPSTVAGLGLTYMSTPSVTSTLNTILPSTVAGLGQIYVSTLGLTNTVAGLGFTYMSTQSVTSTLNTVLPSTVAGLGQTYVSTLGLTSTVAGLGFTYMSTQSVTSTLNTVLPSTVAGLGQTYVSTLGLTSTVAGLGQRYLSTVPLNLSTNNLITSTLSTFATASIGGDVWIGGTQNASWYPRRWICGANGTDNSGTIYYSDNDGVTWRDVSGSKSIFTSSGGKAFWNGSQWVMTGAGTVSRLAYSSNGLTWTDCSNVTDNSGSRSLFTSNCVDVAYNGQIWVACGRGNVADNSGCIAYSSDGINWRRASGIGVLTQGANTPSVNCLKWNGYMWLAGITVGKGGGSSVGYTIPSLLYSYNGINWAQVSGSTGLFNQSCNTIEWNGILWVAGGYGDVSPINSLAYSYDGFNWTGLGNSVIGDYCTSLKWNGQLFVATTYGNKFSATGSIITSPDGFTWTSRGFYFGGPGTTTDPNRADGLGWNGRKWIVSGYGPKNQTMVTSRDGITWTSITNDISGASFNPSYSIDTDPDLRMTNFNIYAQNVPNYLTSSNQILVGASTITLNNLVSINKNTNNINIGNNYSVFSK